MQSIAQPQFLSKLDLIEYQADHHWRQFEQLTVEAQQHLQRYDALTDERRQLAHLLSSALAELEATP